MQQANYSGIVKNLSDSEYHGLTGTYSSSQLKDIIKDPEIFFKKYISKEIERKTMAAFDQGTYFHTALLEPELLHEKCTVYDGAVRRGKAWDEFAELHKGKAILTKADLPQVERIIDAVKDSPVAMKFLNSSESEVSAFCIVYVFNGEVYGERGDSLFLLSVTKGWIEVEPEKHDAIKEFGSKLKLKVRADAISYSMGVISDLKSTTGNAKSDREMRNAVSTYEYDLSAALYLDIFTLVTEQTFNIFCWIFAAKDTGTCRTFEMSPKYYMIGRAKWRKAAILLAKYTEEEWQFKDELGCITPPEWENDWLIGAN